MLNKEKHRLIMGEIVREIYTDTTLAPLLGFKGGTCAYFFYGLTRFSVDLNFDLLTEDESVYGDVLSKITKIASEYGEILDATIKRFTIFVLLSYGKGEQHIKIEISIRNVLKNRRVYYELHDFAGISALVAKKDYSFAMKLVALTQRRELVMRDVYDIYFFGKNMWDIDVEIIKDRTGKSLSDYFDECVTAIENIENNRALEGLGELVDNKQKDWIRNNLKKEAIFQLRNYREAMK